MTFINKCLNEQKGNNLQFDDLPHVHKTVFGREGEKEGGREERRREGGKESKGGRDGGRVREGGMEGEKEGGRTFFMFLTCSKRRCLFLVRRELYT